MKKSERYIKEEVARQIEPLREMLMRMARDMEAHNLAVEEARTQGGMANSARALIADEERDVKRMIADEEREAKQIEAQQIELARKLQRDAERRLLARQAAIQSRLSRIQMRTNALGG